MAGTLLKDIHDKGKHWFPWVWAEEQKPVCKAKKFLSSIHALSTNVFQIIICSFKRGGRFHYILIPALLEDCAHLLGTDVYSSLKCCSYILHILFY